MAVDNLKPDVEAERKKYGAEMTADQCVALINAVAWKNRANGWGLGKKESGSYGVRQPDHAKCSTDGLVHKESMTFVDCLVDSGAGGGVPNNPGKAVPSWQVADNPSNRPWVAPVDPGSGPAPPDPTPPGDDVAQLKKDVATLKVENAQQASSIAQLKKDVLTLQGEMLVVKEKLAQIGNAPPSGGITAEQAIEAVIANVRTEVKPIALNHDHALVRTTK